MEVDITSWPRDKKLPVALLRVVLGWLFFYAGVSKLLNPSWSAAGYLNSAKTFSGFYAWLASPAVLPIVDFLNEWGLTLIGAALILGIFVRLSSVLGAVMMLLYYFPLAFPHPDANSFIVDDHIVYFVAFLLLAAVRAGRIWGLDRWCSNLPICSRYPRLRNWLG